MKGQRVAGSGGVSPSAAWGWHLCNAFAIVYFGSTFQSRLTGQRRDGSGSGEEPGSPTTLPSPRRLSRTTQSCKGCAYKRQRGEVKGRIWPAAGSDFASKNVGFN